MTIDASLNRRLDRVVRTHEKMRRNGVIHRVGRDGLIRSHPRLIRPRFPLQGAFIILGLIFLFKALLFAQVGSGNYASKVQQLREGSIVEQAGAVVMQEEPVTVIVGSFLSQFFFQR